VYDQQTRTFSLIDTCFGGMYLEFGVRRDPRVYFSGGGDVIGWIDTNTWDQTHDAEKSQQWCPTVVDTNGDGRINRGWTEPTEPIDPTKDHRVVPACYGISVNPVDGSVWCVPSSYPGALIRLEPGPKPPNSCKAERYDIPQGKGFWTRGIDFDTNGVAWVSFAGSGALASFDRRKCKILDGPMATGDHCREGWTVFPLPGPKLQNVDVSADVAYMANVDRFGVLGLGNNIPLTGGVNSDSVLALRPDSGEWVRLTIPYPLGFFSKSQHGRIDNISAGWKGRGLWTAYETVVPWHIEGGKGATSKVVKFQIRPDPLAR
jgi:hypothetical protein